MRTNANRQLVFSVGAEDTSDEAEGTYASEAIRGIVAAVEVRDDYPLFFLTAVI